MRAVSLPLRGASLAGGLTLKIYYGARRSIASHQGKHNQFCYLGIKLARKAAVSADISVYFAPGVTKPVKQIEFKGERLDMTSVRRWRDKV